MNQAPTSVRHHIADLIHASVVLFVCLLSTAYATLTHDHSDNIWIVYGSSIAFAAGRAGAAVAQRFNDPGR